MKSNFHQLLFVLIVFSSLHMTFCLFSNHLKVNKDRNSLLILSSNKIIEKTDKNVIVIPKSYNVAVGFFLVSATTLALHNYFAGIPLVLVSILLGVQTGFELYYHLEIIFIID